MPFKKKPKPDTMTVFKREYELSMRPRKGKAPDSLDALDTAIQTAWFETAYWNMAKGRHHGQIVKKTLVHKNIRTLEEFFAAYGNDQYGVTQRFALDVSKFVAEIEVRERADQVADGRKVM